MRPAHILAWLSAVLLAAAAIAVAPDAERAEGEPPLRRLLGPFASLAARVQWIRFDDARIAGDSARAIERAESALALDPGDARGWDLLAHHLAFDLGSAEREPHPERRLVWVRAALEVARRGEMRARDPAALALLAGYVLVSKAEDDPELPWPDGRRGLLEDAAEAFERAARLGHPDAAALAAAARRRAERD